MVMANVSATELAAARTKNRQRLGNGANSFPRGDPRKTDRHTYRQQEIHFPRLVSVLALTIAADSIEAAPATSSRIADSL